MALPLKKTLGQLRADLQRRLGFGQSGNAGIVNSPIMDSFLQDAQEQLYPVCDWRELCAVEERDVGVAQQYMDYPADCNVERIQRIAVWDGGEWQQLEEGISLEQRSVDLGNSPLAYERRDQIELWPVPNAIYQVRIEYVRTLGRFTDSNDRCSLPDRDVFLVALSNAKAHYKQQDAANYQAQADALLVRLKAMHRGKTVFTKSTPGYCGSGTAKDRYYGYPR
jgi:hypothetical protein